MSGDSIERPDAQFLGERLAQAPSNVLDDETSSSGSSSSSEDDFEEEEPENQAPHYAEGNNTDTLDSHDMNRGSDLRSRLQAFLPKLEQANAELEDIEDIDQRRIDDVPEDEERYIEMNLELGVLSELKEGHEAGNLRFRESSGDEDNDIVASTAKKSPEVIVNQGVMSQLKGEKIQHTQKRKIEELGSDVGSTEYNDDSSSKSIRT